MKSAGIILNGTALDVFPEDSFLIAADGGYHLLRDVRPDVIVGDLDSIRDIPGDIAVVRYPPEKNLTDGEIAVRYAVEKGYTHIHIYAALGGRLDHVLGNLSLLKLAKNLGAAAAIREKGLSLYLADGNFRLNVKTGDLLSVIPYGGGAVVESSGGLYYPLQHLPLTPGDTRGISNRAVSDEIFLTFQSGEALVFHYGN